MPTNHCSPGCRYDEPIINEGAIKALKVRFRASGGLP